jgi:hypothetical protein
MRQKQRAQEIRAHIVVENDTRHADTNQRQKNQPSEIPAIAVECVHGFRTSFRVWVQEQTNTPFEVAEKALAHTTKDKVVAAYARSDLFELDLSRFGAAPLIT